MIKPPRALTWHVDWDQIVRQPDHVASAERILASHRRAGIPVVRLYGRHEWLLPLYKKHGISPYVVINRPGFFKRPIAADALHTGVSPDDPDAAHLFCPNARGRAYERLMEEEVIDLCARFRPKVVLVDQEVIKPSNEQERHRPGVIRDCARCGTLKHFRLGWLELADMIAWKAREYSPGVPVYFFNTGYWWPLNSGAGPGPAFYQMHKRAPMTARQWLALELTKVSVNGGFPWICPFTDVYDWSLSKLVSPEDMYRICNILAEHGALGVGIYPSPWSEKLALNDELSEAMMRTMKAGVGAFRRWRRWGWLLRFFQSHRTR